MLLSVITVIELLSAPLQEQDVTVRGFLSENQGKFYLSSMPSVKSCCLGKGQEIEVKGPGLVPSKKVIELHGYLVKENGRWFLQLK